MEKIEAKLQKIEAENATLRSDLGQKSPNNSLASNQLNSQAAPRLLTSSRVTRKQNEYVSASNSLPSNITGIDVASPTTSVKWQGIYAGINAGYGGNGINESNSNYSPQSGFSYAFVGTRDLGIGGPLVGGQVGYNYQFSNNVVLGIETELDYADINKFGGARNNSYGNVISQNGLFQTNSGTNYDRLGLNWLGTSRARLGYAISNFLPFISVGVAYGGLTSSKFSTNVAGFNFNNGGVFTGTAITSGNSATTQVGWALGGGGEYKLADAWSVKGEYLYTSLGGITRDDATIGTGGLLASGQITTGSYAFHQARVGLNYHTGWLGGGTPAVTAKY
jgi:outer membrane immunogenic protein